MSEKTPRPKNRRFPQKEFSNPTPYPETDQEGYDDSQGLLPEIPKSPETEKAIGQIKAGVSKLKDSGISVDFVSQDIASSVIDPKKIKTLEEFRASYPWLAPYYHKQGSQKPLRARMILDYGYGQMPECIDFIDLEIDTVRFKWSKDKEFVLDARQISIFDRKSGKFEIFFNVLTNLPVKTIFNVQKGSKSSDLAAVYGFKNGLAQFTAGLRQQLGATTRERLILLVVGIVIGVALRTVF